MNSTITDQMDHTENPMCSAKIDQMRLRRAMLLPPFCHACRSSGSQPEISCERGRDAGRDGGARLVCGAVISTSLLKSFARARHCAVGERPGLYIHAQV